MGIIKLKAPMPLTTAAMEQGNAKEVRPQTPDKARWHREKIALARSSKSVILQGRFN